MGAAQDPVGITVGAIVGHALCTGLAVLGGRVLAARISERTVATGGGVLFLLFAAHSFVVGPEQ
jgi:putative Ca2+/H+ antiporter (TMEM165/GDT1 family)